MSYERTKEAFYGLNRSLDALYQKGTPYMMNLWGRPDFCVASFSPLSYEEYGTFRNRGPKLYGSLPLRAFLTAPAPEDTAYVFAGVGTGNSGYGYLMNGYSPSDRQAIVTIAHSIGHPEFRLTG